MRVARSIKVEGLLADTPKTITFRGRKYEQGIAAHTIWEITPILARWKKLYPQYSLIVVKGTYENKPYHTHWGEETFYWVYKSVKTRH